MDNLCDTVLMLWYGGIIYEIQYLSEITLWYGGIIYEIECLSERTLWYGGIIYEKQRLYERTLWYCGIIFVIQCRKFCPLISTLGIIGGGPRPSNGRLGWIMRTDISAMATMLMV